MSTDDLAGQPPAAPPAAGGPDVAEPRADGAPAADDGGLWQLIASVACEKRRRLALIDFGRRFVPDDNAALDLVQEAVLRVHAKPPRARTEAAVAACLFRTVHNLGLNERRRRSRTAELRDLTDETSEPTATGPVVVERVSHRAAVRALEAALEELSPRQREVVRAIQVERLDETARRLDITEDSVQRTLRRAVSSLLRRLPLAPAELREMLGVRLSGTSVSLGVKELASWPEDPGCVDPSSRRPASSSARVDP